MSSLNEDLLFVTYNSINYMTPVTKYFMYILYTLTIHFISNTCKPGHSCSFLFSQSCGISALQVKRAELLRDFDLKTLIILVPGGLA